MLRAIQHDDRLSSYLLSTGQHADLVDQALAPFGLTADATLPIDRTAGTLNELAALTLPLLDRQLAALDPAAVMVQGDTLSAMLGAKAAFWRHLPIAHREAGLRYGDLVAPFPEEANRKSIDHLSTLHLAPTETAAVNLQREGIVSERVLVTGNTVVDALPYVDSLDRPFDDPRLASSLCPSTATILL